MEQIMMKMACCDIFFDRMHEAYLEQGLIVKDAKKLRIHYVKNRSTSSESKRSQITLINQKKLQVDFVKNSPELTLHSQNRKLPNMKELNFRATYICLGHDQCPPN